MLIVWVLTITDDAAPPARTDGKDSPSLGQTLKALVDPRILRIFIGGMFMMASAVAVLTHDTRISDSDKRNGCSRSGLSGFSLCAGRCRLLSVGRLVIRCTAHPQMALL